METGEKGPTLVEMKASLPAGSFSLFDFEKEFHMKHGMNPEDADKPWREYYQPQGLCRRTKSPDEEKKSTNSENSCVASLAETIETLQTPGVVRNDTGRELYAENILAFDARLLQDSISGRCSHQQMSDSIPGWYQDSFYDLTPSWVGRFRESPPTFENARSLPTYTSRHRYLPLGPPLDIASTTGPPSTIGPSASEDGAATTAKKVDFDMVPDIEEITSTLSQLDVPKSDATATQSKAKSLIVEGRPSERISQPRNILHTDERRQTHDTTSLEVKDMDITTSEYDVYYGVYPDFRLPLPNKPRISDLFVSNTRLRSHTNSPMSILRIPSLRKLYGTTEFAIDRSTGQLYKIGDVDVTPVNLFGGIPDEHLCEKDVETTTPLLKKPQAMSTPITDTSRNVSFEAETKDNRPLPNSVSIPNSRIEERTKNGMSVVEDVTSEAPIFNLNRVNVQVASSVSSLGEDEGIVNRDEYEKAVHRLEKINKKISILLQNWSEESRQARNTNEITEIEEFL